jgi:Trypsin-co-occurring domain 2
MPDKSDGLPLADFIAALRTELRTAALEQDPDLQFNVGPVTVELTLMTHHEGGGKAGIHFWVVEAGASGSAVKESTQQMTLALTPITADGEPWRVSDKRGGGGLPK